MEIVIIYLIEEGVFGHLKSEGAYLDRVEYTIRGVKYNTMVEKDDYIIVETIRIGVEND